MYCSNCGSQNPADAHFCHSCGSRLELKEQTPPPQPPNLPPQHTNGQPDVHTPPTGYAPSSHFSPPGGYPAQRPGYIPPGGGYNPPGSGYRPSMHGGYPPRKKRNPVLVAAGILLSLAVVMTAVVLLAAYEPPNSNNNPVLADNSTSPAAVTDTIAEDGFRDNYTQIIGGGADTVTVMIYICGADLESDGGCATLDINEMLAAELGDNVKVVLQTGGCTSWYTEGIVDGGVQRWLVDNGRLTELQSLGQQPMLDAGSVTEFINFSAVNFPANRYAFIFWDHGGGSLYGYGYDEVYPETVMFLPDIADGLRGGGIKFDFIGFDACLMGTIETAYMLEPYADYMIGSEETEPAFGWDYTPWLNALGENPSIDTVQLGKIVVDSFLIQNAPTSGDMDSPDTTLSVVALREIPYVYDTLCAFMSNATEALVDKEFKMISTAVARSRAFAEGDYDLIDLVDFAQRADLEGKEALTEALGSAVKYADSSARTGVYGLSLYFPYEDLSVYGYAKNMFAEFGFGGPVYDFYDRFVNILAGGQSNATTRSLKENFTGEEDAATDYSAYTWYDDSEVEDYAYDAIDYTALEIVENEEIGVWYLPLTDADWDLITEIQMQILLDDGEGYIDLGSDQYYETDEAGNLILNYGADNSWIAIGGQLVCYYAEETIQSETDTTFIGYVPAVLNGTTDIDIILQWDGEDAEGYIAGYRLYNSYTPFGGEGTVGKGYKQFDKGDTIDFICDYYTYDGSFDSSYYFGDTMVIGDELPAVTYEDVGDSPVLQCYMIIDVYQNSSWTETVEFTAY